MKKGIIIFIVILVIMLTGCSRRTSPSEILNNNEYLCDTFEIYNNMWSSDSLIQHEVRFVSYVGIEADIESAIITLNNDFKRTNKRFITKGVELRYRTDLVLDYKEILERENTLEYIDIIILPDDVELYQERFREGIIQGAANGIPTFENTSLGKTTLFIRMSNLKNKIISHEMGHLFGLNHIFHNADWVHNNGLNCDSGDKIPDTPSTTPYVSIGNSSCKLYYPKGFEPNLTKEQEDIYVHTIMGYASVNCMKEFTEGHIQSIVKMGEVNIMLQMTTVQYKKRQK